MKGNDFYKTYQTTEWQRKKNSVLERDDYTCQICGSSSGIMQVHHITYKHCKGKAYNAPMGDLITLCEYCHAHDDGDHVPFFNGDYRIDAGEEKPTVYGETEGNYIDITGNEIQTESILTSDIAYHYFVAGTEYDNIQGYAYNRNRQDSQAISAVGNTIVKVYFARQYYNCF